MGEVKDPQMGAEKDTAQMTTEEIEAELEKKGIDLPSRWFHYLPEQKQNFLKEQREKGGKEDDVED